MNSPAESRGKNAGKPELTLLAGGLAVCACVWGFFELARMALHETHRHFDERLLLALREPHDLAEPLGPGWVAGLAHAVTTLGSAWFVVPLALGAAWYFGRRCQWRSVVLVVVTIAGGFAWSAGLKAHYARERPSVVPHLAEVRSMSFPSGHAVTASVTYLALGALLAQRAGRRREQAGWIVAALTLVFSIGVSRVFLGVHYPTDVLAGWILGLAWALACWLATNRVGRRRPRAASE